MQNPHETPSQKSQPQQPTQSQLHCDPQEIQSSSCCSASRLGVPSPVAAAETKNPKFDLVWAPPASEVQSRSSRLVKIPAGPFLMGTDDLVAYPADHEGPVRQVQVSAFEIEKHLVTNAEFAAFVHATGYETDAERFGWSYVFGGFLSKEVRRTSPKPEVTPWWRAVTGANWFYPFGPDAAPSPELFPSLENPQQVLTAAKLPDHPVVHVSWRDASAFAKWCGAELPTEEQWEKAARGGLVQARYAWGNEFMPQGADGSPAHMANIWQGVFPLKNTMEDGFSATSPVDTFPANGYGLFDMAGNVWEMTASNWDRGGSNVESGTSNFDPSTNDRIVIRGGSYLCHDSYCHRYRVSARTTSSLYDSSGNMGFRLAVSS